MHKNIFCESSTIYDATQFIYPYTLCNKIKLAEVFSGGIPNIYSLMSDVMGLSVLAWLVTPGLGTSGAVRGGLARRWFSD